MLQYTVYELYVADGLDGHAVPEKLNVTFVDWAATEAAARGLCNGHPERCVTRLTGRQVYSLPPHGSHGGGVAGMAVGRYSIPEEVLVVAPAAAWSVYHQRAVPLPVPVERLTLDHVSRGHEPAAKGAG